MASDKDSTTVGSAKRRAYEYIKAGIVSGRVPAGDFVTENQIAEELGVSRTPVREALQLLEREGFVRVFPKKGAYVPPMDDQEIREIWEARQVIETYAIRRVVEATPPDLTERLDELLEQQREAGDREDMRAFIEYDREFHRQLVEGAANRVIVDFYESLRDRQLRMGTHAILSSPMRLEQVMREHESIVDALRVSDPSAAQESVQAHLKKTREATKRR